MNRRVIYMESAFFHEEDINFLFLKSVYSFINLYLLHNTRVASNLSEFRLTCGGVVSVSASNTKVLGSTPIKNGLLYFSLKLKSVYYS